MILLTAGLGPAMELFRHRLSLPAGSLAVRANATASPLDAFCSPMVMKASVFHAACPGTRPFNFMPRSYAVTPLQEL